MHQHHQTKFRRVGGKNGELKVPNDMVLRDGKLGPGQEW
jgi:biotin-(acetyl-CoA carboxylase) ligase